MGTAVNRPDRETSRLTLIRRLVMRGTSPPFPQRHHGMVLNYTQTALCCYLHFQNSDLWICNVVGLKQCGHATYVLVD